MHICINPHQKTLYPYEIKRSPEQVNYYNAYKKREYQHFKTHLQKLKTKTSRKHSLIFLCIGSDRATGDCFGPLVGENLVLATGEKKQAFRRSHVYGTLEKPIHAINLEKTIRRIYQKHPHPYIIALDASLGVKEHIGFITLENGPLVPGIGVRKELPEIGDTAITGIVNISAGENQNILQTTRLSVVYRLADFVSRAIVETFFGT